MARALLAHDRQDSAGDVHRADEAGCQLLADLLRRQFLEVAGVEAGGVVDQHVDSTEAINGGPHRSLGVSGAGDVERDSQQVARCSQDLGDSLAVSTGRHNRVAGGQRGPRELDTHAAAGSRNQPDFLAHHILKFCTLFAEPLNPVRELRAFLTLVCELGDGESERLQVPRDS